MVGVFYGYFLRGRVCLLDITAASVFQNASLVGEYTCLVDYFFIRSFLSLFLLYK